MHRVIIFKYRIHLSVFIFLVYLPIFPQSAYTETFNVTNEDELREALSSAESNGEDDTINVATGLYETHGETFIFESDEDFSLTIEGKGAGKTIMDGGDMDRVLEINSVSDADVFISIKGLTIRDGFHVSIPGDLSISNGGGIYVVSQNLTIEDCEFISNSESRVGNGGGLFANIQQTINLSGNLFSQNSAAFSGGGAYISATELILSDNEFIMNSSALGDGGGLTIDANTMHLPATGSCDATITNNIFNSNSTFEKGGGLAVSLYCNNFDYEIINNTFTLNTSENNGGGISLSATADSLDFLMQLFTLDVYNNIIFDNFATGNGGDIYFSIFHEVQEHNFYLLNNDFSDFCYISHGVGEFCTEDVNYQANNIDEDPLFVDAATGDVRLQPNSPCINAGDPDAPDLPDTDIFGNPRGAIPDMGAVEFLKAVDGHGRKSGCSLTQAPVTSSLAVFIAIPVLILIRRIFNRCSG